MQIQLRPFYLMVPTLMLLTSILLALMLFMPASRASSHDQTSALLGVCGDRQFKSFLDIRDIRVPSSRVGQWAAIEGIVTQVSQGQGEQEGYRGFWLQQPHQKAYAGIFVYHAKTKVKRGQRIRIFAQVANYHGLTELKKVRAIKVCADRQQLPKSQRISLPVNSLTELAALEGMRVLLAQPLIVSDLYGAGYGLGNYGQFALSSQLHYQPTELFSADRIRKGLAPLQVKAKDYLLIDDGQSKPYPSYIPFPNAKGFSVNNPLRIGDTLNEVSGILHRYDEHYVLIPNAKDGAVEIKSQARVEVPYVEETANLIVASMNLRNFFNGSPLNIAQPNRGFPAKRGAKSYQGFLAQKAKLVAALTIIDADVIALMELENDGYGKYSAIADLTRALNKTQTIERHYQYVIPNRPQLGADEISVGLLYRADKIKVLGSAKILDSNSSKHASRLFDDSYHRPSLMQTFSLNNKAFTLVVNHFKSKGRPCGNLEIDDLQGSCNRERKQAAFALIEFINQQVPRERPLLIVGDLNSYSQEEPLLALYDAGFSNLNNSSLLDRTKARSFSYSYQGYLGNLDHALVNATMLEKVRSFDSWHINSIEDVLLDYQTEENGQVYPSIDHYSAPDAYRSSDHDPLVIGIEF